MFRKYYFYIFISIVIGFAACDSYNDLPQEGDLDSWELFNTSNGLISDSIYCLDAGLSGYIWAGTWDKGVMMYDGNSWINYTTLNNLPSNSISAIQEDYWGGLWVGTPLGLSYFDGQKFADYKLFGSMWITDIYPSITGDMLIGTKYGGLIRLTGGSNFEQLFSDSIPGQYTVNSIGELSDETVIVGTNAGLYIIDHVSTDFYTSSEGLLSDSVTSVFCDGFGDVWIGDYYSDIITRLDGDVSKISLFNGSKKVAVNVITEDYMSNIWIGTIGAGVVKYDGVSMRAYGVSDGLPGISIPDIDIDVDGSVWFGSIANGISKYTPGGFE